MIGPMVTAYASDLSEVRMIDKTCVISTPSDLSIPALSIYVNSVEDAQRLVNLARQAHERMVHAQDLEEWKAAQK